METFENPFIPKNIPVILTVTDEDGNVTYRKWSNGVDETNTYDDEGRCIERRYNDGSSITMLYDGSGKFITNVVNAIDKSKNFSFLTDSGKLYKFACAT